MSITKSKLSAKEKYLFQLKNAMLLDFTHRKISSTLEDLDSLFDAGREDGRTEEETCRNLGTPKEFVDTLLDEERRTRSSKRLKIYIVAGLLLRAALAVLYTGEVDTGHGSHRRFRFIHAISLSLHWGRHSLVSVFPALSVEHSGCNNLLPVYEKALSKRKGNPMIWMHR